MACIFCDKPCVFSHIPKCLHFIPAFCSFPAYVFANIGKGLVNTPTVISAYAFAVNLK